MPKENQNILEEVYKACSMGAQATEVLLDKVHDGPLHEQILKERKTYDATAHKAAAMLEKEGTSPKAESKPLQKAMLWGSVQMNTMANGSPEHIAEMMIQGTTMGIVDMQKHLNELPKADSGSRALAEEFLKHEQESIDELKTLL